MLYYQCIVHCITTDKNSPRPLFWSIICFICTYDGHWYSPQPFRYYFNTQMMQLLNWNVNSELLTYTSNLPKTLFTAAIFPGCSSQFTFISKFCQLIYTLLKSIEVHNWKSLKCRNSCFYISYLPYDVICIFSIFLPLCWPFPLLLVITCAMGCIPLNIFKLVSFVLLFMCLFMLLVVSSVTMNGTCFP